MALVFASFCFWGRGGAWFPIRGCCWPDSGLSHEVQTMDVSVTRIECVGIMAQVTEWEQGWPLGLGCQ